MKIRPSLRLYFFLSIILLCSIMISGFSLLSVNYFVDGLDKGLNGVMLELAHTSKVEAGQPLEIIGFSVASRWQDTPSVIQEKFKSEPAQEGELYKIEERSSLFSLPESLYFVISTTNKQGEKRYISRVMLEEHRPVFETGKGPKQRFLWILITGLAAIALFSFFLLVIMRKIAKPIESLKTWAKSLDQNTIQKSPPNFTYNELNTLAELVRRSLISAHQSLDREQEFLSYASHELRTPIAVIRSNVDLLKRLSEKDPLKHKQQQTLERIERAGLTMSNLTETLLWLSRNEEYKDNSEAFDVYQNLCLLMEELSYLLHGKEVHVTINGDKKMIETEAVACHIVLSNLIRNAYQHTQHGEIRISQQGSCVSISNSSQENKSAGNTQLAAPGKSTLGYGLGLQMCEKIIARHGWSYNVVDTESRYQVTVDFNAG